MACHNAGHAHLLPRFLQVEVRLNVLACGRKRANGQRARVAEYGCDFVWQSQSQEVDARVRADVLKGQNCHRPHSRAG